MIALPLPPFIGIRIKVSRERARARLRTLDLFVTALAKTGKRGLIFAIIVPKVMTPTHVVPSIAPFRTALERRLKLKRNSLRLELMIATTVDPRRTDLGSCARGGGRWRVRGAHLGVYDYTALVGITRRGSIRATSPATSRGT